MTQQSFNFLPRYTRTKWMFTVICWDCLRIFELPAKTFLQGDPVCFCGGTWIAANYQSRELMDKLKKNVIKKHRGKKIKSWDAENGATFA